MDATTIAVDLAKDVFEVAVSDGTGRIDRRERLSRRRFEAFLAAQVRGTTVVMEACGTAHFWGRRCQALELVPILLPVQYVRAYVRRNKSDRTDAAALLEARRCGDLLPVPVKTAAQQGLQGLHRLRQQWQKTRIARINTIRGLLREHRIAVRVGASAIRREVPRLVAEAEAVLPSDVLFAVERLRQEIVTLEASVKELDARLDHVLMQDPTGQRLQTIPGVGPITATALLGSVPHIHQFHRGRQFASWLGLTPQEAASGHRVWRGRLSKRGDVYLRTLLIHGGRSVVTHAQRRARCGKVPLTGLQQWAVELAGRRGPNKAAAAVANRLARLIWAIWRSELPYDSAHRTAA